MPVREICGGVALSRRRMLGLSAALAGGWALSGRRSARGDDPDRAEDAVEGLTGRLLFRAQANRGDDHTLGGLFVLDLKENAWHKIAEDPRGGFQARFSPDGTRVAYTTIRGVFVVGVEGGEPRPVFDGSPAGDKVALWSPDGRQLLVSAYPPPRRGTSEIWRIDVDGSGKTRVPIPEPETVVDWSRDGRWLLTFARGEQNDRDPAGLRRRLTFVRRADGTDPHRVGEPGDNDFFFAPDGRRIFFSKMGRKFNLSVMDRDGTDSRRVFEPPDGVVALLSCISPDGTRAMLMWMDEADEKGVFRSSSARIEVLDMESGRHRRLDLPHPAPMALDWR